MARKTKQDVAKAKAAKQKKIAIAGGVLLVALLAIGSEAALAGVQRLLTSAGLRRTGEASARPSAA
jgi:hypothetical protein